MLFPVYTIGVEPCMYVYIYIYIYVVVACMHKHAVALILLDRGVVVISTGMQ